MPRRKPSSKLAINAEIDASVVADDDDEGTGISAWINNPARIALRCRIGLAAIAEWEQEHGAFTEEEMEAARRRVASYMRPRRKPRRSA